MTRTQRTLCILISLSVLFTLLAPAPGAALAAKGPGYQTGFTQWQAAKQGFSTWTLSGAALTRKGAIQLDFRSAVPGVDPYPPGGYNGGNYYNGGSFVVGEATGPVVPAAFAFSEAIASWNADTPDGTWIETQIRAQLAGRWTKWYNLGIWASGTNTVQRHSVNLQGDADGYVSIDTLVISNKKVAADAMQLKVRLFSAGSAAPTVRNMSLAYSTGAPKDPTLSTGDPAYWNRVLDVPQCSQMVYPDGGNVWCSPTSTSMVLGFWGIDPGPCEPRVRAAVAGVWDWMYDGAGNWPFNTAYAASRGLDAYVARFTSLAQAEPWIASGVPVVMSIAWGKNELTGAPVGSSAGHLIVLVGFDSAGNPVVNDPAFPSDDTVRTTYLRSELESLWLANSGGTVYLIFPAGQVVPAL